LVSHCSKNETAIKADDQFSKLKQAEWLQELLQTEEAYRIFSCPGEEIFKKEEFKLQVARKLASLGFFEVKERHTVLCVDPDNPEIDSFPDSQCREIISIPKGAQPYSDEDLVVCPKCGHEFFLSESGKKVTSFYKLSANREAIVELFEYRLFQQNIIYWRLEFGKYCVVSGSVSKIFVITDCFQEIPLTTDWVLFRFLISHSPKESLDLADFLCQRRLFYDILNPTPEGYSGQISLPQLVVGQDMVTLGGKSFISAKAKKQWLLFQVFLLNRDTVLSLTKIEEELEKQGEFVTDPEQQIRRPLNKIREKVEQLGYSTNTLIAFSDGGYCFNSKDFRVLYVG
jgi:hypothetical protein